VLFAGGNFTTAGGVPVNHVAKWDGSNWSALDGGVSLESGTSNVVALAVYDSGSAGPHAGGAFTTRAGWRAAS
jgi:hypothetical protein